MAFKTYIPGGGSFGPSVDAFMDDNKKFGYGTSEDYAFLYDSTSAALELSSSTDGKVFWVDDGTNDVHFSGTLHTVGETTAVVSTGSYEAGAMKYVTDGNAGSPCLAVYNGTDWKVVALGATISST